MRARLWIRRVAQQLLAEALVTCVYPDRPPASILGAAVGVSERALKPLSRRPAERIATAPKIQATNGKKNRREKARHAGGHDARRGKLPISTRHVSVRVPDLTNPLTVSFGIQSLPSHIWDR